jgi:hypothetical protein
LTSARIFLPTVLVIIIVAAFSSNSAVAQKISESSSKPAVKTKAITSQQKPAGKETSSVTDNKSTTPNNDAIVNGPVLNDAIVNVKDEQKYLEEKKNKNAKK